MSFFGRDGVCTCGDTGSALSVNPTSSPAVRSCRGITRCEQLPPASGGTLSTPASGGVADERRPSGGGLRRAQHRVRGRRSDERRLTSVLEELCTLLRWVASAAEPNAWWAQSSLPNLEMWMWFDRDKVTYRTRKSASKLMAQIERSARSTREAADPAQLARLDVSKLLEKIAQRMDLDQPPHLP